MSGPPTELARPGVVALMPCLAWLPWAEEAAVAAGRGAAARQASAPAAVAAAISRVPGLLIALLSLAVPS
jgi:hypothetical protein